MTDLLQQEYLAAVLDDFGRDTKNWPNHAKIDVIDRALYQCNNYDRLESCMKDFWRDHKMKDVIKAWSVLGLWNLLEPEIVAQIEELSNE